MGGEKGGRKVGEGVDCVDWMYLCGSYTRLFLPPCGALPGDVNDAYFRTQPPDTRQVPIAALPIATLPPCPCLVLDSQRCDLFPQSSLPLPLSHSQIIFFPPTPTPTPSLPQSTVPPTSNIQHLQLSNIPNTFPTFPTSGRVCVRLRCACGRERRHPCPP